MDSARLEEVLALPSVEDQRRDDPEQSRLIGFVGGWLVTCIVAYRANTLGEVLWVVTAWHATAQEQRTYEQAIR
jgi:hypothetical protein